MNKKNDSAFFGIPRSLLSSARNLPQWFHYFFCRFFVVSLYSNCAFEFNTESQNLSSNTSLFFSTKPFFFLICCFLLWRRIKKAFLLTEQTNLASVNLLHTFLFVFECSRIQSHAFIFRASKVRNLLQTFQLLSRGCSAPPHSLPATLLKPISFNFIPHAVLDFLLEIG